MLQPCLCHHASCQASVCYAASQEDLPRTLHRHCGQGSKKSCVLSSPLQLLGDQGAPSSQLGGRPPPPCPSVSIERLNPELISPQACMGVPVHCDRQAARWKEEMFSLLCLANVGLYKVLRDLRPLFPPSAVCPLCGETYLCHPCLPRASVRVETLKSRFKKQQLAAVSLGLQP